MQRRGLRRFQLFLLLIAGVLVIWRMTSGPEGEGFVHLSDMESRSLYERSFEVHSPAGVTIEAVGSFEDDGAGAPLAVYPWIVHQESSQVVWQPDVAAVKREGVQAIMQDSVTLDPGLYSVYFTTEGPRYNSWRGGSAFGLKPHWTNYEDFWRVDLITEPGLASVRNRVRSESQDAAALVSIPLTRRGRSSTLMLHASGAAELRAQGGITVCPDDCDLMTIKEIPSGIEVWSTRGIETEAAGGSEVNRLMDESIQLAGGVYEFNFFPGRHNDGSWTENPPWLPSEWTFNMTSLSGPTVRPLDPWRLSEPIVDHLALGDSEYRQTRMVVSDSLDVILYAMGEMTSPTSRYDWGWIENEDTGERLWEMTWDETTEAGGDSDNRQAKAILRVPPGNWVVAFETDGSHSYPSFNRRRPANPERWGMAVFPLDPDGAADEVVTTEEIAAPVQTSTPTAATGSRFEGMDPGRFLMRATRMTNNEDYREVFVLDDTTRVIVAALGELTESSSYDYGWIEDVDTSERVWEMTWSNTTAAGGDSSYRQTWSELTLPPASYRVAFQTDGSISYDGFGTNPPDNPEDWGIAIFVADE